MNKVSNNSPSQAMAHLNQSLNAYSMHTQEGNQPVPLLKMSSALHVLLPTAIEAIRAQNDYHAVTPEHLPMLRHALEDSLKTPFNHLDGTLVHGGDFNVLMAGFRNLLNHLPHPEQFSAPAQALRTQVSE